MAIVGVSVDATRPKVPQVEIARALLTVLAVLPFLLGWTVAKAWLSLTWLWAAVLTGWQEAHSMTSDNDEGG